MKQEVLKKRLPTHNGELTYPQRRFISGVVSGLNPTKSAKIAYPTQTPESAKITAHRNMHKPKIKTAIERALTKANLSEDRIVGVIDEAIGTKTPHTIDWNTKHNYIKTALQLKGYLNNKDNNNKTQVNVQLNLE